MIASKPFMMLWRFPRSLTNTRAIAAGCIFLLASFLPWLRDPFGKNYSAWELTVNLGWQVHIGIFNYGILCLCCAGYCFFVAYVYGKSGRHGYGLAQSRAIATLICLLPVLLFLLQYLCIDFSQISLLAQQKVQMLSIQQHYGYRVGSQLFSIKPFSLDISTLTGRLQLLVGLSTATPFLSCISALLLRRYLKSSPFSERKRNGKWILRILLFLLLFVAGKAIGAILCEDQAKAALSSGSYSNAIEWLDVAGFLNPSLEQASFYHAERGQALHYMYPEQSSDDSRLYLASIYEKQGNYLNAYQQLLVIIHEYHNPPKWAVNETSTNLEQLVESANPLKTRTPVLDVQVSALKNDQVALYWLRSLLQIDPNNLYGQYVIARIAYDMHDYALCIARMNFALTLSVDEDFLSSAYTFMALSHAGQRDYKGERALLLLALQHDPAYRNNAAREEMSGLR